MTREEFTERLPAFTFDPIPSRPPFEFKGLSARLFPLRANLNALQQLCDRYLNFVPPEVGRFRAAAPYVYLALLDYGEIAELLANHGWFAQKEVFFGVPVEWYKLARGRWVFHDWAVITPYIYVDDDFSAPMGRTVFGFPKILARVTPAASQWWGEHASPVTVARVETAVFPELYEGRRLESRVFLEVERAAPMSNLQTPADLRSPIAPWVVASNLADAVAGRGRDAMWQAQSMRIFPVNPGANPAFAAAMLERLAPAFAPGGTGVVLNSLNLKQFRCSDDPSSICYQALTNGRMQMLALDGAGLLGEERTLLGDETGGYTINLHEYSSLPIARTLGLEVHRRWRGDGVNVASLKPVLPFWMKGNTLYQQGINLAWRTRHGAWRGGDGEPLDGSQSVAVSESSSFNTTVACAIDAVVGPFQFTGTTVRVLPLLAHRETLERFLGTNINKALHDRPGKEHLRLSAWARREEPFTRGEPVWSRYACVYMTVSSFGQVSSKTNNVGDWAKYELQFLIPVKLERKGEDGRWRLEAVGVVPAFSFVDDSTAAVSRNEVLGIQTGRATFVRPESVWLSEEATNLGANQTLLRVNAEVIPALGVGQQAAMHSIIEISSRDSAAGIGEPCSQATAAEWADTLRVELAAKKRTKQKCREEFRIARALALELLGRRVPVSLYTLKQFRDVADPGKACYQELVRVSRAFDKVCDVREIEETIQVRIHDFPTLKPVESLGIVADILSEDGTGLIYGTQAIRPFYIRATIDEALGERLLSRAGTLGWEIGDDPFRSHLTDDGPPITVDGKAGQMQDQGDPCQMNAIMNESGLRRPMDGEALASEVELDKKAKRLKQLESLRQSSANVADAEDVEQREREIHDLKQALEKRKALKKALEDRGARLTREGIPRTDARKARLSDDELGKLRLWRSLRKWRELKKPSESRDARPGAEKSARATTAEEPKPDEGLGENDLSNLSDMKMALDEREEWRLRQGLTKKAAIEALALVDPQMVIESLLSREWGNADENARWRVGRQKLHDARDIGFSGGSASFAALQIPGSGEIHDVLENAIRSGRVQFASVEAALYEAIRDEKAHRPGSPRLNEEPEVTDAIERMEEFTTLRLEMEDCFSVLAARSILRWCRKPSGQQDTQEGDEVRSRRLVIVMRKIADLDVIGEPSKDSNLDTQVRNNWMRLDELLKVLEDAIIRSPADTTESTEATFATWYRTIQKMKGFRTETERLRAEGATEDAWRLIDEFREAVHLARKYCDAQRNALLNKLSRAYQKPDFCIRRDSVGPQRDDLLPISLSWDEHWYYGERPEDEE